MQVEIGPIALPSAQAWLGYAETVIDELRTEPRAVTADVVDAFSKYIDDWQATADAEAARNDLVFRWKGEALPETVEYLVFALYRLGVCLSAEEESGRRDPRPAAVAKFHGILVRSLLIALEREGEAEAHFVRQLREVWGPANERT
jgi:hypothetical protein